MLKYIEFEIEIEIDLFGALIFTEVNLKEKTINTIQASHMTWAGAL